ncbi:MAG: hypothetical protein CM15mP115_20250 [Alphaproteobacteria bacterium]|nr:MAG: hypothetical protein CM15mP115_20250 [Alphaproteobacteria bacterium]
MRHGFSISRAMTIHDRIVRDLPSLLRPGDVLVVNNTRVIPARLAGRRGEAGIGITLHKHEGGADWQVFAKPARKCRPDDVILFGDGFAARVRGRGEGGEVGITFIDPHSGDALDPAAIESRPCHPWQHAAAALYPPSRRQHIG